MYIYVGYTEKCSFIKSWYTYFDDIVKKKIRGFFNVNFLRPHFHKIWKYNFYFKFNCFLRIIIISQILNVEIHHSYDIEFYVQIILHLFKLTTFFVQ